MWDGAGSGVESLTVWELFGRSGGWGEDCMENSEKEV